MRLKCLKKRKFLQSLIAKKTRISKQKQKRQHFYVLKKTSKREKVAYSLVCFLCSLKTSIRNCLFVFYAFYAF